MTSSKIRTSSILFLSSLSLCLSCSGNFHHTIIRNNVERKSVSELREINIFNREIKLSDLFVVNSIGYVRLYENKDDYKNENRSVRKIIQSYFGKKEHLYYYNGSYYPLNFKNKKTKDILNKNKVSNKPKSYTYLQAIRDYKAYKNK